MSEFERSGKVMVGDPKQPETAFSKYAQHSAINPTKIPSKMPENFKEPICVAMKKTEEATFKAAVLAEKVIHSMQDLPDFESPMVGSSNMRECIENMNHNVDMVLSVLDRLLCTFGETYE